MDEAAARLLREEGEASFVVVFSMNEADVRMVLAQSASSTCPPPSTG